MPEIPSSSRNVLRVRRFPCSPLSMAPPPISWKAQDHKHIGDNDTGPNTGGMGAYSPAPLLTEELLDKVQRETIVPLLDSLKRHEIDYRGILYTGLMLTAGGHKVLEFNARFGDPECQPLMLRLKSDLVEVMLATVDQKLEQVTLQWDERPAVCVVLASEGYGWKPDDQVKKGVAITGLDEAANLAAATRSFSMGAPRSAGWKTRHQRRAGAGSHIVGGYSGRCTCQGARGDPEDPFRGHAIPH